MKAERPDLAHDDSKDAPLTERYPLSIPEIYYGGVELFGWIFYTGKPAGAVPINRKQFRVGFRNDR